MAVAGVARVALLLARAAAVSTGLRIRGSTDELLDDVEGERARARATGVLHLDGVPVGVEVSQRHRVREDAEHLVRVSVRVWVRVRARVRVSVRVRVRVSVRVRVRVRVRNSLTLSLSLVALTRSRGRVQAR